MHYNKPQKDYIPGSEHAYQDAVVRISILCALQCAENLGLMLLMLQGYAAEYGPMSFMTNSLLTLFFMTAYLREARHLKVHEVSFLELIGVLSGFTFMAGFILNRCIFLLLVR